MTTCKTIVSSSISEGSVGSGWLPDLGKRLAVASRVSFEP
jgi:hypothetical protein